MKTLFTNATFWSSGSPSFTSMLIENETIIAIGASGEGSFLHALAQRVDERLPRMEGLGKHLRRIIV